MIKKKVIIPIILSIILVVLVLLNFLLSDLDSLKGFSDLFNNVDSIEKNYLVEILIPRVIAAILVGASLSVAGLLLQTMLNNSIASPSIVGINSGAGLGIVLVSVLIPFASPTVYSLATLLGAFLSSMLIYLIARLTGASRGKLILAGVAISRLVSAIIDIIIFYNRDSMSAKQDFQLGSFRNIISSDLYLPGILIIIGLIGAIILARYLDILILGDETATSLGLNVKLTRFLLIVIISILSSAAVTMVGLLSFLGLIIPHIVKKLFGVENHKKLVLYSIFIGATFTLLCDLLARYIDYPQDMPVGIILALIGIPFFIYLLFNKGGKRRVINSHKLER